MIAALVPNIVSMTSSLDCSYSFHYFCLLMSKKNLSLAYNNYLLYIITGCKLCFSGNKLDTATCNSYIYSVIPVTQSHWSVTLDSHGFCSSDSQTIIWRNNNKFYLSSLTCAAFES